MIRAIFERATSWTAIFAFVLGLWLGYRGAVRIADTCLRGSALHEPMACPTWVEGPARVDPPGAAPRR